MLASLPQRQVFVRLAKPLLNAPMHSVNFSLLLAGVSKIPSRHNYGLMANLLAHLVDRDSILTFAQAVAIVSHCGSRLALKIAAVLIVCR